MSTHSTYPRIEIYQDAIGQYRYRLISAGKVLMFESSGAFRTTEHAKQAARAAVKSASMAQKFVVLPYVESEKC